MVTNCFCRLLRSIISLVIVMLITILGCGCSLQDNQTRENTPGKHSDLVLKSSIFDNVLTQGSSSQGWEWLNPLPQGNPFNAVWGSSGSDVFAVGDYGTIFHYNGSTWSSMASGTIVELNGVWGSSGSDVFAVGGWGSGNILHYNGSTWSSMTSGAIDPLCGVWGSSGSDVFAVGHFGTIFHYNGSTWSSMTNPLSGTTVELKGVWGSSGSDVFCGRGQRNHPPLQRQHMVQHGQRNNKSAQRCLGQLRQRRLCGRG